MSYGLWPAWGWSARSRSRRERRMPKAFTGNAAHSCRPLPIIPARTMTSVDFGNGWNLTPDQWSFLHTLDRLYDLAEGQPDRYVTFDVEKLVSDFPFALGRQETAQFRDVLGELQRAHLTTFGPPDISGAALTLVRVGLTRAGVEEVKSFRRRRADAAARRPAVRDALLRWLYELHAPGQPDALLGNFWLSNYTRFLRTDYDFFKLNEVEAAVRWLETRGYLTRTSTSYGSIQILTITGKGERLVESGRSTSEDEHPMGSVNISFTNSPGANAAVQSSHVTQTTAVTMTKEGQEVISNIAKFLEGSTAQAGMSTAELEHVPALVAELRAVASEPAVEPSKLRGLLDVVKQLAIGAAASGPLAIGLDALVYQAIHVLGLG